MYQWQPVWIWPGCKIFWACYVFSTQPNTEHHCRKMKGRQWFPSLAASGVFLPSSLTWVQICSLLDKKNKIHIFQIKVKRMKVPFGVHFFKNKRFILLFIFEMFDQLDKFSPSMLSCICFISGLASQRNGLAFCCFAA